MSALITGMVFNRYPNGGGEMLLALALADHAADDGSNIYPSVKRLAEKTRQSERTVQYQLRRMEASGWLIPVADVSGGRSRTTKYKISPEWVKGAEIAPIQKGANDGAKGCNLTQERVQSDAQKGATGCTRNKATINKANINKATIRKEARASALPLPDDVDAQTWTDWLALRKAKKAPVTETVLTLARREAEKAGMPLDDFLQIWCARGSQGLQASWLVGNQNGNRNETRQRSDAESAVGKTMRILRTIHDTGGIDGRGHVETLGANDSALRPPLDEPVRSGPRHGAVGDGGMA